MVLTFLRQLYKVILMHVLGLIVKQLLNKAKQSKKKKMSQFLWI